MATGNIIRWVHVLAGVSWLGLILSVIFVLVPTLRSLEGEAQTLFLQRVFPRVFRLASVLSATAVVAGVGVYLSRFGWVLRTAPLVETRWGRSILVGAILGTLLTVFHFAAEAKLEPAIRTGDSDDLRRTIRILTIAPRIGVFFVLGAAIAMMYAARGL